MIFRRKNKHEQSIFNLGEVAAVELRAENAEKSQAELSIEDKIKHSFEQLNLPIFRYLAATFGDKIQAEEITQEVFLKLYQELSDGKNIENTKAWAFRVAHNLAVNQIKRLQFVQSFSDEAWTELEKTLDSKDANPEQNLLLKEKYRRLRRAVGRLTMQERQCLNLRTKGFRYREIAEMLEISSTSVAETLYRVIEKLADETNE